MRAEAINRDQVADWLDEAVGEFAETRDPGLRDQIVERGAWLAGAWRDASPRPASRSTTSAKWR